MNGNINELAKKLHLAYLRNNLNEILDELADNEKED